ncbi:hypothetical protein [Paractinoplanes durhamensis]|uniref:Uncharacterized protein n=1 Tax=Paractinoplanes durhamensis TaxID=113563 RepID=A0ABQ3Z4M4_9ACTN|nr:hypothetical protein [Actinoplanes durhamensis]GIE04773.1 hypothetical protein Adu01nite_61230 [Actinoplanes durhamensis]
MTRLAKQYRLLLRAYPPGHRRTELLDTLLDAAPATRNHPTARETANLLRHGMRARLGRPGGRAVVVLATLIALTAGFIGAAAATRAAWELVPGYPTGTALAEISDTVFPSHPTTAEPNGTGLFFDVGERNTAEVLLQGHDEDFEFATVTIAPEPYFLPGDFRTWTATTEGRLVKAGWQVGPAEVTGATTIATGEVDDTGRRFTATRDGLALTIEPTTDVVDTPRGSFYVTATLDRLTPGYVTAAGALGLLTGALIGWLLTGWASRRTESGHTPARATAAVSAVFALVLLLPQALLGFLILGYQMHSDGPPGKPFWTLSLTYGFGCGQLGAVLIAVALIAAAAARRPAEEVSQIAASRWRRSWERSP